MRNDDFEAVVREGECFHSLRIPDGSYGVVRVDGRSFTALTARLGLAKPFDTSFHEMMVEAASALLLMLRGVYAYTESDEISVLLPRRTSLFNREVEKIVSLSAGRVSSVFSLKLGQLAEFDARVWVGKSPVDVFDYFRWRQADALRASLNGWAYWTLRQEGRGPGQAQSLLNNTSSSEREELLAKRGICFSEVPAWQRKGVGLFFDCEERQALNPKTGEMNTKLRRVLRIDKDLLERDAYAMFLGELITASESEDSLVTPQERCATGRP
jgi:tRNA(His) 5'-end guanylyltransferase